MSFIRIALRGTLPGGESWSVNPAFNETTNVTTWNQTDGQAAATAIGLVTVPAELKKLQSSGAAFATVRVERRTDADVLLGAAEAPWVAGGQSNATPNKPFQTSLVLSLRTEIPGGRHRGRMYWPALSAELSTSTLRLSSPTAAAVATAAASYLDLLAAALKTTLAAPPSLIDYDLAVYSPTNKDKTRVSRIEVGDVLDVQRRRRDRIVENIASAPMP